MTRLEKEGHAGSYIKSVMKAVKSWLRHNHIALTSIIRIKDEDSTPTLQGERVPTLAELGNILRSGPPGARVAASLMAFSGLRPEVLGNYRGTDGLRLADLPELTIDDEKGSADFKATPAFIVVRESLSKAGHQYLTFLADEACLYLKEYLEARCGKVRGLRLVRHCSSQDTRIKPSFYQATLAIRSVGPSGQLGSNGGLTF